MDSRQLILAAAAAIVLLAAAYYLMASGVVGGNRYAGTSFQVQPSSCAMGSDPLLNQNSSRVTLRAAYFITNTGQKPTALPASVYLVVGDEIMDEQALAPYTYQPGAMLFNGTKEFSFYSHEFRGGQFDPSKAPYGGKINFDFRLIYCAGCSDPIREGLVIYNGNTGNCARLQCSTCSA